MTPAGISRSTWRHTALDSASMSAGARGVVRRGSGSSRSRDGRRLAAMDPDCHRGRSRTPTTHQSRACCMRLATQLTTSGKLGWPYKAKDRRDLDPCKVGTPLLRRGALEVPRRAAWRRSTRRGHLVEPRCPSSQRSSSVSSQRVGAAGRHPVMVGLQLRDGGLVGLPRRDEAADLGAGATQDDVAAAASQRGDGDLLRCHTRVFQRSTANPATS